MLVNLRTLKYQLSNHSPLPQGSRKEKPSEAEERAGLVRFVVVNNDGSPVSSILLTGLKNLFQRQLPNMPREYITRLTFDRNAQALAIVQRGYKVVGGITYRPFPQRQFAEIVFFAISGLYQVNVRTEFLYDFDNGLTVSAIGIWWTFNESLQDAHKE